MISTSFGLLFYLKKPKGYVSGDRPIYLRITVDHVAKEISMQRSWQAERWDPDKGRPVVKRTHLDPMGENQRAIALKDYLDTWEAKVHEAKHSLMMKGLPLSAGAIKNILQGREPNQEKARMLMEVFQYHNNQIKALTGSEYSPQTLSKFRTAFTHTKSFLKWKFKKEDIDIRDLDFDFISELEFWFKSEKGFDHNTTIKYIGFMKKIVNRCVRNGWLSKDPFLGFSMALREVPKEALTEEEMDMIAGKSFPTTRLEHVRDIFLFSCYTGLAYSDVRKLAVSEIGKGVDGTKWIFTRRTKTDSPSRIPLLPQALDILLKYERNSSDHNNGKVLPILSNQKMNAYLKEIADCCGIKKPLTFHIARHTFATTVTLSNGVPIETVSKMLGHKDLKTTQHYAKVLDRKVGQDMQALREIMLTKGPVAPTLMPCKNYPLASGFGI